MENLFRFVDDLGPQKIVLVAHPGRLERVANAHAWPAILLEFLPREARNLGIPPRPVNHGRCRRRSQEAAAAAGRATTSRRRAWAAPAGR